MNNRKMPAVSMKQNQHKVVRKMERSYPVISNSSSSPTFRVAVVLHVDTLAFRMDDADPYSVPCQRDR